MRTLLGLLLGLGGRTVLLPLLILASLLLGRVVALLRPRLLLDPRLTLLRALLRLTLCLGGRRRSCRSCPAVPSSPPRGRVSPPRIPA